MAHEAKVWEDVTEADIRVQNFGALLSFMNDVTFVAWLPAWLVFIPRLRAEVPDALVGFGAALSPEVCLAMGQMERLQERVSWLDPTQRRAVAAAGLAIAGDADIIRFAGIDIGRDIADAWERYADAGFR